MTIISVRVTGPMLARIDQAVKHRRARSRSEAIRFAIMNELSPSVVRGGRSFAEARRLQSQIVETLHQCHVLLQEAAALLPKALLTEADDLDDEREGETYHQRAYRLQEERILRAQESIAFNRFMENEVIGLA